MSTLLNLASQVIPVGTYNYGPYSLTAGESVTATVSPTVWPASGQVFSVSLSFDGGGLGGGSWQGSASIPKLRDGVTNGIGLNVQPQSDTQVSVQIVVAQAFTASLLVASP